MIVPRSAWIALGASAGILLVRRAQAAAKAVTPAGLADRAGAGADTVAERARAFVSAVKAYADEREAELRDALGLDEPEADTLPSPSASARPAPRSRAA